MSDGKIKVVSLDNEAGYDQNTGKKVNPHAAKEAFGGGDKFRRGLGKEAITMRKAIGILEDILNHSVYLDKHADSIHGTGTNYIEIYGAVAMTDSNGNKDLYRIHLSARERDNYDPNEIGLGILYHTDIEKIGPLPQRQPYGMSTAANSDPISSIILSDLMKGVNDRKGVLYVDDRGKLNRAHRAATPRQLALQKKREQQLGKGRVFTDNATNDKAEKIEAQQQISDVASAVMEPTARKQLIEPKI